MTRGGVFAAGLIELAVPPGDGHLQTPRDGFITRLRRRSPADGDGIRRLKSQTNESLSTARERRRSGSRGPRPGDEFISEGLQT